MVNPEGRRILLTSAWNGTTINPAFPMKRAVSAISIAVLWFGLCALQASKQSETASISEVVSDPRGQVIPRVRITVTNTDSKSELKTLTGEDGKFAVSSLQPGIYKVSASLAGMTTTDTQRTLASGESAQLNMTMNVAPFQYDVTGIVDGVHEPGN